jgi:hypothetical protein
MGLGAVVDGLQHLGTNEGAACDNALKRDHLAELGSVKRPWADMVVSKRAAEANPVTFSFNLVLFWVMNALNDAYKGIVERGKEINGLF